MRTGKHRQAPGVTIRKKKKSRTWVPSTSEWEHTEAYASAHEEPKAQRSEAACPRSHSQVWRGVLEPRTCTSCQAPAEGSTAPSKPQGGRKEEQQGPGEPSPGTRKAGATADGAWPTAWPSLWGRVLVTAARGGLRAPARQAVRPGPPRRAGLVTTHSSRGRTPGLTPAASHLAA